MKLTILLLIISIGCQGQVDKKVTMKWIAEHQVTLPTHTFYLRQPQRDASPNHIPLFSEYLSDGCLIDAGMTPQICDPQFKAWNDAFKIWFASLIKKPLPQYDTIRVVMLVCDTSTAIYRVCCQEKR